MKRFFNGPNNEGNTSMRKSLVTFCIFVLMLGGLSSNAYAVCGKDTPIDQTGDWFATFGKKGLEKDQILAKRKADRLLACARKEARQAVKDVQKSGASMKKRLGL
jgi:hypothetical protein